MRKFVVIKDFKDLKDNGYIYRAGDFYPREGVELDEERAEELASDKNRRKEPLIVEVLVKEEKQEEKKTTEKPTSKTKAKK